MSGSQRFLIPLRELLSSLPLGSFTPNDGDSILDKVGIDDFRIEENTQETIIHLTLVFRDEIGFTIIGVEGLGVYFGSADSDNRISVEVTFDSNGFKIKLVDTSVLLRFSPTLFRPVKSTQDGFVPDLAPNGSSLPYQISLKNATIELNKELEVSVTFPDAVPSITFPPMMIADTGVIVEANDISLIFSQAAANSLPPSIPRNWRGVYLQNATFHLPEGMSVALPSDVQLKDFFIGSRGFSGQIIGQWSSHINSDGTAFVGNGTGTLFGVPFAIWEIAAEFKQNILVSSRISGPLILPFFDQPVLVEIGLASDRKFTIALSSDQSSLPIPVGNQLPQKNSEGLFVFTRENLLKLIINQIGFEYTGNNFITRVSGAVKPLIRGLEWPQFEVRSLAIDSHGLVKIDGGWIDLPKQKSFDLYGFSVNITKIGFGNEEDDTKWIGLSGGIKLVDGLPLEGGVEGLKIKWKESLTDIQMEIGGIRVAFEIKDVLEFNGSVVFIDQPTKKGFKGGVKMVLYPLDGCSLDMQLLVGKNNTIPQYNFFYTYIDAQLPIGVPLFSTGLALYGMGGLFGYNMEPSKGKGGANPNETWYENPDGKPGWYLRGVPGITDAATKWVDKFENMAFGAGVTLGTLPDNGFNFSAKTLIVLLIPGPVIIVEGKANFLKERKKLDDQNPLFRLLAVYDNRAGTFLMNIEANYALPQDTGKVIKIRALAEAFFDFNNSQNWHLYIGQDQPEAKRIRSEILNLFGANAYFMLTSRDLAMGVWVGYANRWKFGPLSVELSAWMEGKARITFKPAQAEAMLALQGSVQLRAFRFSVGLSVAAGLLVQTPNPFIVRAEFSVKLDLPRPLPDPKARIVLEWKKEKEPPIPVPLAKFGIEHLKATEKWTLEKYPDYDSNVDGFLDDGSQAQEQADAIRKSPVVPLDARPVMVFAKPVEDTPRIGDNPMPAPPAENIGKGYQYRYRLLKVILEKRPRNENSGGWTVVAVKSHKSNENVGELYGKWQSIPEDGKQVNTKLMLWTNTAFEISRELSNNDIFTRPIIEKYNPCSLDTRPPRSTCIDFEKQKAPSVLPPTSVHDDIILYSQSGVVPVVNYDAPKFKTTKALLLGAEGVASHQIDATTTTATTTTKTSTKTTTHADTVASMATSRPIYIAFSKPVAKVELSLGRGSSVIIYPFEEDSQGLQPDESSPYYSIYIDPDNEGDIDPVTIEGKGMMALMMTGVPLLAKICYVTVEEMKRANDNKALQSHIRDSIQLHWSHHKDILFEPDMYYKLTAESEVIRNNKSFQFMQHSYFQTEGPSGVYSYDAKAGAGNDGIVAGGDNFPTGGPLKDLAPYVKHTIPKPGQKPVYRAYDIGVIFNESYVDQMYLTAGMPLSIELYDNNDEPALDTDGTHLSIQNLWGDNPQVFLTREEQQWISLLGMNECVFLSYKDKPRTKNLYAGNKRLNLKPETLYKAKIVAVSSFDKTKRHSIYQFSFITSRYTSFTHQIQSFQDALWSHRRMSFGFNGQPAPILTADQKNTLEQILSSFSPDNSYQADFEYMRFQQISELLGLSVRQLPASSIEILALDNDVELGDIDNNDNSNRTAAAVNTAELTVGKHNDIEFRDNNSAIRCYGFLIESPEPIDWNRTELKAKYNASTTFGVSPLAEEPFATGAVKIIGASIISSSSSSGSAASDSDNKTNDNYYNNEWVDFLLREEFDISGFSIEHMSAGSTSFKKYMALGTESKHCPAGTIIRAHTGKKPNNDANNPSDGIDHRYAELNSFQFSQAGETIKVLDKEGKILHFRYITPQESFSNKDIILIRNADNTRAFVFFPSTREKAAKVDDGRYLLNFKYKLNIGDNRPILKRMGGIATDEDTTIEFLYPAVLP